MKNATSKLEEVGGRNNPVRTTAGSKEDRFILNMTRRDDQYLVVCDVFPFGEVDMKKTSFPYAQAASSPDFDEVPVKTFISYNITVQNSCGQSVCDFYDQSLSWPPELHGRLYPLHERTNEKLPKTTKLSRDAARQKDDKNKCPDRVWRTRTLSPPCWNEGLVNSVCIVNLKEVFKDCTGEDGLVIKSVDGPGWTARGIQIKATGAYMYDNPESIKNSPDFEKWANTTDYLTYTTHAFIRKPKRKLKPGEKAAIALGAMATFCAVVAALILLQRRRKLRRLLSLMQTKEKLQVALLESTSPPRSIDKDICFVSTDIQSSTAMRVRSLEAYEEATQLHHNLLRQTLQEHGGVELLCEGDGFILGFDSAWAGTAFCCDLQQALQDVAWSPALQRLFRAIYKSPAPDARAGGRRGGGCLETARLCSPLPTQRGLAARLVAFNGLRVRCGVHWAAAGTYELEQRGPNAYVPSGPGYQRARLIGDVGHGGQVILSKAAQTMLLCNLQAAKFPTVRDLGLHRLAGSAPGDAPERLYQVTPSVGEALKLRRFAPPRTAQELEPGPGSSLFDSRRRSVSNPSGIGDGGDGTAGAGAGAGWEEITLVAVFVSDRKSFEEAAGRGRISPAAWDEVRKIVKDANRKFWGWRVDVGGGLAALKGSGEGRPRDPEIARGGMGGGVDVEEVLALTADFQAQEAEGQAWLLAFEDAQDALRFCLSCCIELTYSPWEGFQAWRGGSSATTPDGAALWNGPPVGFTVHSVTRGGASSGDAGAGPELHCTRFLRGREETIRGDVGAGLLEALVAAQLLPSNARVVLTGPAWASLNEGLGGQPAHFGKAVVEHLGRVHVPCLSRPLEAYHVLPVQLAARTGSFVSLRDAAPECLTLLSPGARDAPRPTAHLTFMFTAWFAPSDRDLLELARRGPSGGEGGDGTGSGHLAAELQRICWDCHGEMQAVCVKYDGYVVEEIGPCEFLLAFPSAVSAASFACAVQVGLHAAVRASSLLEGAGLGAERPLAPSGPSVLQGAGAAGGEGAPPFTGFLAAGVATVGAGGGSESSQSSGEGQESPLAGPAFRRRLRPGGDSLAFANVHPVTGRRTYSTPAMNKAARAKALARGGQVLLADLRVASEPSAAESSGSGWMLSWLGSFAWRSSSWRGSSKSRDSALHLPPKVAVETVAGTVTASAQALDGVSMRGFGGKVGIARLVAELPGEGPAVGGGGAGGGEGAGGSAAGSHGSGGPRRARGG